MIILASASHEAIKRAAAQDDRAFEEEFGGKAAAARMRDQRGRARREKRREGRGDVVLLGCRGH